MRSRNSEGSHPPVLPPAPSAAWVVLTRVGTPHAPASFAHVWVSDGGRVCASTNPGGWDGSRSRGRTIHAEWPFVSRVSEAPPLPARAVDVPRLPGGYPR